MAIAPPAASSSADLPRLLLLVLAVIAAWKPAGCLAATFGFDFHHRFSPTVRRWAESENWVGGRAGLWDWPEKGSVEYYAALAEHDRVIRGRGLAGADSPLTFSDGNKTLWIGKLGFLHYANVSVGTPSASFLVALDTGSDLFWLPCDCKSCAPTSSRLYGLEKTDFGIYNPNSSASSKKIPCSSAYCDRQTLCSGVDSPCPYKVAYASENTSSSGILVQDVLHLVTDDSHNETVEAQIVFGCGEIQTGSFLRSAAPNGLFGLGMDKISVPSILSGAGLTSNSFSMCFGDDGFGRISFGDKGSSDQDETPFNIHGSLPTYNVTVTEMRVGNSSIAGDFVALVDSGTSFTYLADPAYTSLTDSFDSKIQDQRLTLDSSIPFEYCYVLSESSRIPTVGLKMNGGSEFPVSQPIIAITTRVGIIYCFAVIKSPKLNIIGQNFMTGLRIVFDREKRVLGWKKFNCYDVEDFNTLPVKPRNPSAPSPTFSAGPSSYNPEATETTNNTGQTTVQPSSSSYSQYLSSFRQIFLILFLLSIAIL